jgi:hypothetical protein
METNNTYPQLREIKYPREMSGQEKQLVSSLARTSGMSLHFWEDASEKSKVLFVTAFSPEQDQESTTRLNEKIRKRKPSRLFANFDKESNHFDLIFS